MVRRRSGKSKVASKSRGVDRRDSKVQRWNKASDIPLDEEDQFHASRDKLLLDDDDAGGSDDGDEDEVFALKGMPDDGSSGDEDEDEDGEDGGGDDDDIDDVHYAVAEKQKKGKKKGKGKKGNKDESDESQSESGSDEEEGWGANKSAYYASNAEQIESDDEEANELEEQEARRLQAKARDAMAEDDFGLEDVVEGVPEADAVVDEPAQPVVHQLPQDKQSLLRYLEKTNPEALALANDWEDVAYSVVKSKAKIERLQAEDPNSLSLSMMHLHYQALLTYATTLAFYLHLRTSEKFVQRPDLLQAHPIIARLLMLKQSLHTLEELDFAASDDGSDLSDLDDDESELDWMTDAQDLWAGNNTLKSKSKGLEQGELEELLREANALIHTANGPPPRHKAKSGSKHGPESETKMTKPKRKAKADEPAPPRKKRKAGDASAKPAAPVFDLVEPEFASGRQPNKKRKAKAAAEDVYGEAAVLDAADAADKHARKKSLRFHVARIESTAARRAGARAGAIGGDDDIPYRERKREKEARVAREVAKARAQGDDLDDVDPELGSAPAGKNGKKRRRDEADDDDGGSGSGGEGAEGGYYELVQRKSKEKKEKKKLEYEAALAAARHVDEESVDGPRSLTRAILKNKGLTPKRPKSVRNPRVKKRQKFEQAKKKVASQKAVYKGGVDATRYSGEKTGISQTVKSVRLS
ncbi:Sas10 C-terminal domain-containing protein [Daedaleopsis nitida]|nr:Sas10 C-terminal domain-containing protein [Daedaleopsis nitida]